MPPPLTQGQLVGISIACAVVVLATGLAVTLVLAKRNTPKQTSSAPVAPPINPAGTSVRPVQTKTCSPVTVAGNKFTPVTCTKTSDCTGCVEYTDMANAYTCVPVGGGNNMVDASGQLVHPLVVHYTIPDSVPAKTCSGHGTRNSDGTCVCDKGYSGDKCNVIAYPISTPGAYCLPAYAQSCADATTDSVLVNTAGGKGGQFACQCKPEYETLFTQTVEGGPCDQPLVCGGGVQQPNQTMHAPQLYSVATGFDRQGNVQFDKQPVIANRLTSATSPTVTCYVPVSPATAVTVPGGVAYTQAHVVQEDADPRCHYEQASNYCESQIDASYKVVVRGSNKPGDPLLTRAYPFYYPPVPPGLQRCPDGYSGDNTPSKPCTSNDGKVLQFQPPLHPCCANAPQADLFSSFCLSAKKDTLNDANYGSDWYTSVFTEEGEWNGHFTCMADLKYARVKVDDKVHPVTSPDVIKQPHFRWQTVAPYADPLQSTPQRQVMVQPLSDVNCLGATFASRNSLATMPSNCNGGSQGKCDALKGHMQVPWDGSTDNGLFDKNGAPWFMTDKTQPSPPTPTFGGQCSCDGLTYAGNRQIPAMAGYMSQNTGDTNWWQCVSDRCATAETPRGHLYNGAGADFSRPRCVCDSAENAQTGAGPTDSHTTYISFRPENEFPTCVRDPCNPYGYHTSATVKCSANDDCSGVCKKNKCYYKQVENSKSCKYDSDCTVVNTQTPGVCDAASGKCVYQDPQRADAYCKTDDDCSNGVCSNVQYVPELQPDGTWKTRQSGTCSGGCVCNVDAVQQREFSTPLGFTCKKRCDVYPCINGGTGCRVDPATGEQSCTCKPCFHGETCEKTTVASHKGEFCIPGTPDGEYNSCCEGTCQRSFGGEVYKCQ